MHPMKKYLVAFVFSVVLFACSPNNVTIDSSVVKIMDSAGVVGSFALLENGTGKFTIANLSHYKDSASSPLSSFFILPTLIALDKGIINQNQASWVSMDSTPYYQNIITQIGRQEILKTIDSIKYGKEGGETEVAIINLTNKKALIRVTDNGEGIEQQNIPRLFERFYRVDKSGSRSEGGSGLGLAIVKHIIEAHKEKIYVESEFGIGSEFSFTIEKTKIKKPSSSYTRWPRFLTINPVTIKNMQIYEITL